MVDFIKLDKKWQKRWKTDRIFESDPTPKAKGFYVQVAYPYPSGAMHIGHARTYSFPDMLLRYKRMQGYNTLMPMGWHVTGTPVLAQTELIKKRDPKTVKLMTQVAKVPKKDLGRLENPVSFVKYFVNTAEAGYKKGMNDLGLGIDWRREITTMDKHYNQFITWQYNKLHSKGLVKKGNYPIRYCPNDEQAVGDHDLKEGEGVGITNYTLLKFKFDYKGKKVFLVAATLRPETIYGQTNFWVNPSATYVLAEVDGEEWIISESAAKKLSYQRENLKVKEKIKGSELVGRECIAPLLKRKLLVLPSTFVDASMGTGLVTSVPSDAPYDYIALKELQDSKELCKKYRLDWSEIKSIKLIPIIKTKDFGDYPAKEICEKLGIKNQKDTKLDEATQTVYKSGFHTGVMGKNCGKFAGQKVTVAKEKIKKDLLKSKDADLLYELESKPVICRCGSEVTVGILKNQWFLKYSDGKWKKDVKNYFKSMKIVPEPSKAQYEYTFDWLEDKPCARQKGLGTRLPWDKDWIIEPLADSTIYFAFFTISHILKKLKAEQLTGEVFDYAFLGNGTPAAISRKTKIPVKLLKEMRSSFEYWYPLKFNVSASELIPNHMSFTIFHHTAIFPKKYYLEGEIALGVCTLDSKKMSSSKGHVILVSDITKEIGADLTRLFLVNFAEPWQDSDWQSGVVKTTVKAVKKYFENTLISAKKSAKSKKLPNKLSPADKWILSRINRIVKQSTSFMDDFMFRKHIQLSIFEFMKNFKWYQKQKPNQAVVRYVLDRWTRLIAPITPHIAEEIWSVLGNKGYVVNADWPKVENKLIDDKAEKSQEGVRKSAEDITNILNITKKKAKKIYLYVIPPELNNYKDAEPLFSKEFGAKVKVFASNDSKKIDPEGKAKKARPGKPGIYIE